MKAPAFGTKRALVEARRIKLKEKLVFLDSLSRRSLRQGGVDVVFSFCSDCDYYIKDMLPEITPEGYGEFPLPFVPDSFFTYFTQDEIFKLISCGKRVLKIYYRLCRLKIMFNRVLAVSHDQATTLSPEIA